MPSKHLPITMITILLLTVSLITYMIGKIERENYMRHDRNMWHTRYDVLAGNVDYVTLLDAEMQWRKKVGVKQ